MELITTELVKIILTNILWISYSVFEGMRECAFKVHKEISKKDINLNIERIFIAERTIIYVFIGLFLFYSIGLKSIPFILGQLLLFKFFKKTLLGFTYTKLTNKDIDILMTEKDKKSAFFGFLFQIVTYLILFI